MKREECDVFIFPFFEQNNEVVSGGNLIICF